MATRSKPAGCCAPKSVKPMPDNALKGVVAAAKALAAANRVEIVRYVAAQDGPACTCDIVDHLALSQPTVSHHLKILKNAGLLQGHRDGLWSFYEVNSEALGLIDSLGELSS